jgi:hypothetical protein
VWVNAAACRECPPDELQHVHLLNGVNFVEADVDEIERAESQMILENGAIVSYDFLILLTARQGEVADMCMAKSFIEESEERVAIPLLLIAFFHISLDVDNVHWTYCT